MVLVDVSGDLEPRATLLPPLGCFTSVRRDQPLDIPNPSTFGNDPRLGEHAGSQLGNDGLPLETVMALRHPHLVQKGRLRGGYQRLRGVSSGSPVRKRRLGNLPAGFQLTLSGPRGNMETLLRFEGRGSRLIGEDPEDDPTGECLEDL